jgi:tetratricopeptide (TPR) repeat protein
MQTIFSSLLVLFMLILVSACDTTPTTTTSNEPYSGAASCAGCHETQSNAWLGSHHDLAIQTATPATALGDFSGSTFDKHGISSRFFSTDEQLFVETDGSDGRLSVFPVRYTFGVHPLQQYLLEMPDGKIQALSIAWDSRDETAGGQRWFHLYGDEQIDHTDILHWTQPSQNWETMCADCHSTNLLSEYNLGEDRFTTTWSELNVACEACHGPGAKHIAWAQDPNPSATDNGLDIHFDESAGVNWVLNPETGNSTRSQTRTSNKELNACAGCHSRRSRIAEGNHPATPYLDTYTPALIEPPLYHADGQILDEVYVYGSFLQSKMHAAGVTCSDCHDPHSLKLRAPREQVCSQCHASETFATTEHQMHAAGVTNCIDCHMPATTYMQIDPRNDHSFRIPRPALSLTAGTPNACNGCHTDKDALWATQALQQAGRINNNEGDHWSARFATSTRQNPSLSALATDATAPPIIRATAASYLSFDNSPAAQSLLQELSASPSPLVQLGVARSLAISQPELMSLPVAMQLVTDDTLSVRLAATSALLRLDPLMWPAGNQQEIQAAYAEYKQAQLVNIERPESHINIANLERMQGRLDTAERGYQTALTLNPRFVPAYVNLADLYRQWAREPDAEATLRAGLDRLPEEANLHHALGLSLIRQNRIEAAKAELKLAAESPNATPRFALVYAVALNSTGETDASLRYLEAAMQRFGNDPQLQGVYAEFSLQAQ